MILSKGHVTASSQVMLPTYPVFSGLVGLSYFLGDPDRTASPSFDFAREIMPIRAWGLVFLALTATKVFALITHNRRVMIVALCAALGAYITWTLFFLASLLDFGIGFPWLAPAASITAVWLWGFVSVAHVASLRSLTRDVVVTR